jgi:hypothetical protein
MRPVDLAVVTGLHRSGTTLLGTVLASASGARLLEREPLNPVWGLAGAQQWYHQLDETCAASPAWLSDVHALRAGRPVRWRHPGGPLHRAAVTARCQATVWRTWVAGDVLVVKDPFLSLSLPQAVALTRRPVVVTLRHPCGWALSLQRMQWHPGSLLDDLVARPALQPVGVDIGVPVRRWTEADPLLAAAWTWRLLTTAVLRQVALLPPDAVHVMPLENLRDDPVARCLDLLRVVGLAEAPTTRTTLEALTRSEAVSVPDQRQHLLRRDAAASVEAWRDRMDGADKALVWNVCAPTAAAFYAP